MSWRPPRRLYKVPFTPQKEKKTLHDFCWLAHSLDQPNVEDLLVGPSGPSVLGGKILNCRRYTVKNIYLGSFPQWSILLPLQRPQNEQQCTSSYDVSAGLKGNTIIFNFVFCISINMNFFKCALAHLYSMARENGVLSLVKKNFLKINKRNPRNSCTHIVARFTNGWIKNHCIHDGKVEVGCRWQEMALFLHGTYQIPLTPVLEVH